MSNIKASKVKRAAGKERGKQKQTERGELVLSPYCLLFKLMNFPSCFDLLPLVRSCPLQWSVLALAMVSVIEVHAAKCLEVLKHSMTCC